MIKKSFSKRTNLNTLCFLPLKYIFFLMSSSRRCPKRCYRSLSHCSMMILRWIWPWNNWSMFSMWSPICLISSIQFISIITFLLIKIVLLMVFVLIQYIITALSICLRSLNQRRFPEHKIIRWIVIRITYIYCTHPTRMITMMAFQLLH